MALVKRDASGDRVGFAKIREVIAIPNLIEIQQRSYEQFLQMRVPPQEREDQGLQGVFTSIFPIQDYDGSASLEFVRYEFGAPKYTADECREKGMTFSVPLKVTLRLVVWDRAGDREAKSIRDIKEQEVYLGEMPVMTEHGTFIINGTERVVVSQLHRSPGVFFDHDEGKTHSSGKFLYTARVIPYRGSWLEFEFDGNDILHVRIDRRRKFLATILLRAIGFGSNEKILEQFYERDTLHLQRGQCLVEVASPGLHGYRPARDVTDPAGREPLGQAGKRLGRAAAKRMAAARVKQVPVLREDVAGRILAADVHDARSGEVLGECGHEVTPELLDRLAERGVETFQVLSGEDNRETFELRDTLRKDSTHSEEEALIEIYRRMRPGDPPTIESTRALLENLFFNPRRYDLSKVGRLKMNSKLGMDVSLDQRVLRREDVVAIVKYLLRLKHGEGAVDDIDHLGNRRVRAAGELLEDQFRIGLARMERAVRERMSTQELETLMPHDLVNAKPVTAALKEFFGSSQLSQFMDQTNPLAELTHKRRLSALGPGGLSRERAGFEVRDVHPTHYGRMCPIETPEGPNVGLIASLSTFARVNDYGFIETPYRKVRNGQVTDEVEYLTADREEGFVIAQANAELDGRGRFTAPRVSARHGGNFVMVPPEKIEFMDVSPKQLVGVSTALIPFLEHDDANRALMGANMQRQAVPLLRPDSPVVGTGMEHKAAKDSGSVVVARRSGVVKSVSADRIIVRADRDGGDGPDGDSGVDIYALIKFRRSNQNTCINQRPIVRKGDRVQKDQVIADGPATQQGELALGQNVLVAFMPWGGYNFEDAILISEKLVKEDRYTSIHIEEFEIEARDTKLGKEEITRDIPNVGEDALKDLDESGIIRIGAEVKPGDILVGKVTPKGETVLTPEERLLRAIFGEKAEDVRDASLYVPPGIYGTVVDVKVFSRKGIEKDVRAKSIEDEEVARLRKDFEDEITIITRERDEKIKALLLNRIPGRDLKARGGRQVLVPKRRKLTEEVLAEVDHEGLVDVGTQIDDETAAKVTRLVDAAEGQIHLLQTILDERISRVRRGDELAPGVFKMVKVFVAMKRKLSVGDKIAGRHGNKGVIAKILPEEDMPYLPDGTPVEVVLNPLGVPSRMNVGQILETHLGWAATALGMRVASPVFDGAKERDIKDLLKKAKLPPSGKTVLYDGRTGKPFHQPVTVGYIYLMKLAHLVDDKIHARSIGPYSLVTQQPLGGKAQFGGQRFGEMEVWALEAYGAAHTLQEILTVKSDDVVGRTKMYESIVKGECNLEPGLPESFNVLVKELQSLALDVELQKE